MLTFQLCNLDHPSCQRPTAAILVDSVTNELPLQLKIWEVQKLLQNALEKKKKLKNTRKWKLQRMAADKVISVEAARAAVLSEVDGRKTALTWWTPCFCFPPDWLWQELLALTASDGSFS